MSTTRRTRMSRARTVLMVPAGLLLVASLAACGNDESSTATDSPKADGSECSYPSNGAPAVDGVTAPPEVPEVSGEIAATIALDAGDLPVTLDAEATPCTVGNFVSLVEQGYYEGTECHRLTTSGIFVLQCGDPTATGSGGPGYSIPDELTGSETYPAGTIAMAKTAQPDSGGSQFFLVYEDTELQPDYTVFGTVDEAGLEVLRAIAEKGTVDGGLDGPPADKVTIESVAIG